MRATPGVGDVGDVADDTPTGTPIALPEVHVGGHKCKYFFFFSFVFSVMDNFLVQESNYPRMCR